MAMEDKTNVGYSDPPSGRSSWIDGVLKVLLPIALLLGALYIIFKLVGKKLGISKSPEAQLKMAEVRQERSASRAVKREDKQDRKDLRATVKSIRQEKRACKRATRGIRRKGGARKRAKAACNDAARAAIAAARSQFKDQEGSEAILNSGMGADGDD